jgi:hypothetical protein
MRKTPIASAKPQRRRAVTNGVYGVVTQFDAATGVDTFRADVGHKRMAYEFDYPTNTLLSGSSRS